VSVSDQVEYLAYHDSLTGLANRAAMDAALAEAVAEARLEGTTLGLAYVDLNDFKRVNDSLGHDTGDALLREVAARLRSVVRPGDLLARRGGDEFLVLVRGCAVEAESLGQRLIDALAAPVELGAAELLVEASVGVSVFPGDADSAASLLAHADAAMYEAKSEGGGVTVYGADTADPLERLALAARLRRAIERGELELHYQPVCRARDGGVLGIEALVRWRDPERGLIPPLEFIPVAERAGVIDALGAWVLEAMCVQAPSGRRAACTRTSASTCPRASCGARALPSAPRPPSSATAWTSRASSSSSPSRRGRWRPRGCCRSCGRCGRAA
jgi:diguanylate cyclase (GGDEF)-like protein